MELVAVILSWLLTLTPSSFENEPEDARRARLTIVAEAWGSVADEMLCEGEFNYLGCKKLWKGTKKQLIVALGDQAWNESKIAKYVQDGNCRPWECDPIFLTDARGKYLLNPDGSRVIYFRARSMFQLHNSIPETREHWHNLTGSDYEAVRNATWAMANFFRRNYCGGNMAGMFSSGSGKGCAVSVRGKKRYEWYVKETRVFNQLERKSREARLAAQ